MKERDLLYFSFFHLVIYSETSDLQKEDIFLVCVWKCTYHSAILLSIKEI